jgi:hypothetical protein
MPIEVANQPANPIVAGSNAHADLEISATARTRIAFLSCAIPTDHIRAKARQNCRAFLFFS